MADDKNVDQPSSSPRGSGPRPPSRAGTGRQSWWPLWIWLAVLILIGPSILRGLGFGGSAGREISYTTFREHVAAGRVASITIQGEHVEGTLKEPYKVGTGANATEYTRFQTYIPPFGDDKLLAMINDKGINLTVKPQSQGWLEPLLVGALPILLMIGLFYMVAKRMQSQGQQVFSMGRSRAKLYDRHAERTTYDDVAGAEGVKTELREIIDFLRDPRRFQRLGGKPPRGVLLVGPPGTGKTLLARATAGEAEVPFFSITGSDFMEMFVGVGASRVRSLFQEARKAAPSIIFIDELDSIGRRRGTGLGGGHDEREQTLNQLLSEMDGFQSQQGVVVMAATNRPDILDSALLRPGRFDRHVTVDLPTKKARIAILKIHARHKPLADDVDLADVAAGTPGFSGADLENLLNEAALLAGRRNHDKLQLDDIEEARDKIMMGIQREGISLSPEEIRLLSYHESGHAVVAATVPNADPLHKVTIVPRGHAMGVTQQLPDGDRYIFSREYIQDRITVMLGGRAAEHLVLHTATSGSENDLKQAVRLARRMVLEWGMSDRLANLALGGEHEHVFLGEDLAHTRPYSDTTAREIDREVAAIVERAFDRAVKILEEHRAGLDRVAEALSKEEELMGHRVLELLRGNGVASAAPPESEKVPAAEAPVAGAPAPEAPPAGAPAAAVSAAEASAAEEPSPSNGSTS